MGASKSVLIPNKNPVIYISVVVWVFVKLHTKENLWNVSELFLNLVTKYSFILSKS
jgi:hypothetical protein